VTRDVPTLDISFPQLTDGDATSVRPINLAIRAFVDGQVHAFLDGLGDGKDPEPPVEFCKQGPVQCDCEAACIPTWVSSRITSVACGEICGGGAYPNTGWWTLVLDTSNPAAPRPMRLDELVRPERRGDFWRALELAVRKNAACSGAEPWSEDWDEWPLGDLSFFVTPEAVVVLAPLPHVALAEAECAFPRKSSIAWLRPGIAW
jgi:hypothetical protein